MIHNSLKHITEFITKLPLDYYAVQTLLAYYYTGQTLNAETCSSYAISILEVLPEVKVVGQPRNHCD